MSVRLGALVCFAGLAACSYQPVTAIKAPSPLPFAPVAAAPPATPEEQAPQASADLRTTRSEPSSTAGGDADLERERIRRLSMADGSL